MPQIWWRKMGFPPLSYPDMATRICVLPASHSFPKSQHRGLGWAVSSRRATSKILQQLGVASNWSFGASKSTSECGKRWCISMSFWSSKFFVSETTSDGLAVLESGMDWRRWWWSRTVSLSLSRCNTWTVTPTVGRLFLVHKPSSRAAVCWKSGTGVFELVVWRESAFRSLLVSVPRLGCGWFLWSASLQLAQRMLKFKIFGAVSIR